MILYNMLTYNKTINNMTTFNNIPSDVYDHIASFLNPCDLASYASSHNASSQAVRGSLEYHYNKIKSFGENSFLGQLASKHPLEESNDGKIELVKRVWSEALAYIRANQSNLTNRDWTDLGIRGEPAVVIPALTFEKLNLVHERIQTNLRDRDLERVFTRILVYVPMAQRPALDGDLRTRAAAIRNWMQANGAILGGITHLELHSLELTQLPQEIMQLHNLQVLYLSDNPITCFPENLNLPQLRWLDLSGTSLTRFPENLNLPLLEGLNLLDTPLTRLPENLNLPQLWRLWLGGTSITHLPDNLRLPQMNRFEWCVLQAMLKMNQVTLLAKQTWNSITENPDRTAAIISVGIAILGTLIKHGTSNHYP